MSIVSSRRLLLIVLALMGLVARRAECTLDVTGLWYLAVGLQQGGLELAQTGGTLQAAGSWAVHYGTIDSTTGALTLNLADLSTLSCGTFTGTVRADGRSLSGTVHLFSTPPGCSSMECICSVRTDVPLWGAAPRAATASSMPVKRATMGTCPV